MQMLIDISKYVILAILCCALLITRDCSNLYTAGINFSEADSDTVESAPAVDSSVWESLSRELKLDHRVNSSQVQKEIRRFVRDQERFYSILNSAAPYIYYIYKQTQARGLPAELALIPAIESEFNPNDISHKGATGLWQLMPQTARELGVQVKYAYDGRRNVIASTNAALAYFKDLGNMFDGNWYLAIAAYNCGQMRVFSAIRRIGSHSFWNLPLPTETKYYVPRLLAVAELVKNPAKYGIKLPKVHNRPYFTPVESKKPVSLEKVAQTTGVEMKTLNKLNPDYNHGPVPTKGKYTVLVPANKAPIVKANIEQKNVTASVEPVAVKTKKKSTKSKVSRRRISRKRHQ
jgi:membrane-bound lytic murein transglycosylase D